MNMRQVLSGIVQGYKRKRNRIIKLRENILISEKGKKYGN